MPILAHILVIFIPMCPLARVTAVGCIPTAVIQGWRTAFSTLGYWICYTRIISNVVIKDPSGPEKLRKYSESAGCCKARH